MIAALTPPPIPQGAARSIGARLQRTNVVAVAWVGAAAIAVLGLYTLGQGDRLGALFSALGLVACLAVALAARRGDERLAGAVGLVGGFGLVVGHVVLGGTFGPAVFFVVAPVLLASATLRPWVVILTAACGGLALALLVPFVPGRVVLERSDVLWSALVFIAVAAGVAVLHAVSWNHALQALHGRDVGMRSADARYRLVAEATSDLVALLEPASGEVLYASPSHQRILGLEPGWLDARSFWFIVHPEDRVEASALVERAATQGSARGLARIRHAEGHYLTFETAVDAVEQDGRRVVAMVSRDVTAQRGLQEQLAQAQKMEIVGRLAGGIAHDFNNLLTVARSAAEFARDGLAADHPVRRELDDLIDATSRGAGLTRQLLQLARKEGADPNARCKVEKVLGDLGRLLPRVLGGKVRYEAHTELGLGEVVGQAVQVEQVILNLALNARDAMPSGGTLSVRAFRMPSDDPGEPRRVALEVRDTGTGMRPEVVARLFEPFFTTKPPGVGNGLGLATSRTIVTQLGGDLRVWTEPGKGTAFTLVLPELEPGEPTPRLRPAGPPDPERGAA